MCEVVVFFSLVHMKLNNRKMFTTKAEQDVYLCADWHIHKLNHQQNMKSGQNTCTLYIYIYIGFFCMVAGGSSVSLLYYFFLAVFWYVQTFYGKSDERNKKIKQVVGKTNNRWWKTIAYICFMRIYSYINKKNI